MVFPMSFKVFSSSLTLAFRAVFSSLSLSCAAEAFFAADLAGAFFVAVFFVVLFLQMSNKILHVKFCLTFAADGFYRFVPDGEDGDSVYAVIEIVTDETEYDEAYWTVFCLD